MRRTAKVSIESRLAADPDRVWAHATAMRSINRELGPLMKMTYPKEVEALSLGDPQAAVGEPLFDSWILLGGVLPVDRMTLVLAEIGPGRRFVEQSRMLVMRRWRHERWVTEDGDGCTLHDRVEAEPPVQLFTPLVEASLRRFFRHRHEKLADLFGRLSPKIP